MENRKLWYYLTSLKPFVSKKLNFFSFMIQEWKACFILHSCGMKAYFQNLQKVVVFACGQYLSKLTNLTDDVPRLLATNWLTKPKSGEQMCAEYDGLYGHCMYFNEHFADFRWTGHTDLSIAYSAEYWRSVRKLVRFPCKRLIDPLWELIDGFDIVDWFSILQGIT